MCEWSYYIHENIYIIHTWKDVWHLSLLVLYRSSLLFNRLDLCFFSYSNIFPSAFLSYVCIFGSEKFIFIFYLNYCLLFFLLHKNSKFLYVPQNSSELWWKYEEMWFLSEPGFLSLAFSLLACQYGFSYNFIAFFWGLKKSKIFITS